MLWSLTSSPPGALPTPADVPKGEPVCLPKAFGADGDHRDHWFATTVEADGDLVLEGLAGVCEIWVAGARVLTTRNMFRSYRVRVPAQAAIHVCVRALAPLLKQRRARPRWKTALVAEQNLRFFRISLLGRMPGWSASPLILGPSRATLEVEAAVLHRSDVAPVPIPDPPRWWPHTHGNPALVPVADTLVGFRTVAWDTAAGRLTLLVNGTPVFARGACWTVEDPDAGPASAEALVLRAVQAGANMLRIGGTMAYASEALLNACDRHGVMIWQDFMFANMDYPFDDAAFIAEVRAEVREQVIRLAQHPCVVIWCGGSEVYQQAAMLGISGFAHPFYEIELPALIAELHPGAVYVPNTPSGGVLPFFTREGLTHYYGVGAYRRPLGDLAAANVRFSPEFLGFSNVPDGDDLPGNGVPHHPDWKAGVPRDSGAGWDFEDVRDHYLRELWQVDPVSLRSVDLPRYLALSRAVTGEVMQRAFAHWRAGDCGGGLVWFFRDLRPGAGWGILDHRGEPKPVWWALRRAWASTVVLLNDAGLDGVDVSVINEGPARELSLEIVLVARGQPAVTARVTVQGGYSGAVQALLPSFADLSHAYRFGPPRHEVVLARLWDGEILVSTDALFPGGHALPVLDGGLGAQAVVQGDRVRLTLRSQRFLQHVWVSAPGWEPDDNGFHLLGERVILLRGGGPFKAWVTALNLHGGVEVRG